jgi:hypothetical protein
MPFVKGIQKKSGKNKFEVLLLSVDKEYSFGSRDPVLEDLKSLKKEEVDWKNVMLPHGFDDTQHLFNLDGYGTTLIGPDGTVLGIDIQPEKIEALLLAEKARG